MMNDDIVRKVENIKNMLSDENRKVILDIFEQIQSKYEQGPININDSGYYYKVGVVDGINHCWKVIMGEVDDYLDKVK